MGEWIDGRVPERKKHLQRASVIVGGVVTNMEDFRKFVDELTPPSHRFRLELADDERDGGRFEGTYSYKARGANRADIADEIAEKSGFTVDVRRINVEGVIYVASRAKDVVRLCGCPKSAKGDYCKNVGRDIEEDPPPRASF